MWFFREKIYFGCNKCGDCCRDMDIPLNHYDILRIIKSGTEINIDMFIAFAPAKENELDAVLLYSDYNTLYLTNKISDNSCIFLENNACSIYSFRPNSCRTWPFSKSSINKLKIDSVAEKLVQYACDRNRFKDHRNISNIIDQGIVEIIEYRKLIQKWNIMVSDNLEFQTIENFVEFIK